MDVEPPNKTPAPASPPTPDPKPATPVERADDILRKASQKSGPRPELKGVTAPKNEVSSTSARAGFWHSRLVRWITILVIIGAVCGAGWVVYSYMQSRWEQTGDADLVGDVEPRPLSVADDDSEAGAGDVLTALARHIVLPDDEEPQIVTLENVSQLREESSFYVDAREGNQLVAYADRDLALVYDPDRDLIVAAGAAVPLPQGSDEGDSDSSEGDDADATATGPANIVVLNGTDVNGLAGRWQETLESDVVGDLDVSADNAADDYEVSLVIVLDDTFDVLGKSVAAVVGVDVTDELPSGETVEGADIVVIIGSDND